LRAIRFVKQNWLFLVIVAQLLFIAFVSGYLISGPFIDTA
jgi:hypothetical protein